MFEFDIEDFKDELNDLTHYSEKLDAIEEKIDELESLADEIETAIGDICAIRELLMTRHDNEVWQKASQCVKQMANNSVTVDDDKQEFAVDAGDATVKIVINPIDDLMWCVSVSPTEFIASNAKRHNVLETLASALNLSHDAESYDVYKNVSEEELNATLQDIISNLRTEKTT